MPEIVVELESYINSHAKAQRREGVAARTKFCASWRWLYDELLTL